MNLINERKKMKTSSDPDDLSVNEYDLYETKTSVNSIFQFEEISPDDEIYTFQCPKSLDKETLLGKSLNFSQASKLTDVKKNELLHFEALKIDKQLISIAFPMKFNSASLITLPLNGHVLVRKELDTLPNKYEVENDEDTVIQFPEDIKRRHPLLGINWKMHLSIADEAIAKSLSKVKKNKKTKSNKEHTVKSAKHKRNNSNSEISSPCKKSKKS